MDSQNKSIQRLKKLYNMLYELNFFRQQVIQEHCALPNFINPYTKDEEEDSVDQEFLSEYLMPFIKPGEKHLDLIEFIIQKICKEQFEQCKLFEDDPIEYRVKRIRIIASRLGLLTQSKFSKNLNFSKVIEGKSGVEPSVKFIYDLAKLAKAHLKTKIIERELAHRQLFLDCTYTMSNLINIDVNPFSVDFPIENELLQHDDLDFHISNIEEEVNRDNEYLDDSQTNQEEPKKEKNENQEEELENQLNQLEQDVLESFELSKEDLAGYKNQLDFFKEQVLKKETARLQKKIQQQDFDRQDEKMINIDSKFQKLYRNLQKLQEQVLNTNSKYNIQERLDDIVNRISQLEEQNEEQNETEQN